MSNPVQASILLQVGAPENPKIVNIIGTFDLELAPPVETDSAEVQARVNTDVIVAGLRKIADQLEA